MGLKRLSSIFRYLSWSNPIYKWKVSRGNCPLCGKSHFLSFKESPFQTRCLRCKATITNLSLIPIIAEHAGKNHNHSVYELSTYGSTLNFLKLNFSKVFTSEYFPDKKCGELINGILNQDVQKLTFADNTFDIITSNQVFEHVPDDIKGFSECFRVLANRGALIFSIPLYNIEKTTKIASIINNEIVFTETPEYHDSRLGGAKSAPVFYHHSIHDICDRVKSVGFSKVILKEVSIVKTQGKPQLVIYAIKQ
jgi:SAM-dependent methyltransferase